MRIIILVVSVLLFGCKGGVKVLDNNYLTQKVSDTIIIRKTERITDTFRLEIPVIKTVAPQCDSLINAELRNQLQRLNTAKHSGIANYGFYFDAYKDQLIAYNILEEKYDSISKHRQEKTVIKTQIKEIPKAYTPHWIKLLAWLGVAFIVYILWRIKTII